MASQFPQEQFRKRGVSYVVSEKVKSDIYVELSAIAQFRPCDASAQ